jgi:hypothetical protein
VRPQYPTLSTFVTLSPVPGFRRWMEAGSPGVRAALEQLLPPAVRLRWTPALGSDATAVCVDECLCVRVRVHAFVCLCVVRP